VLVRRNERRASERSRIVAGGQELRRCRVQRAGRRVLEAVAPGVVPPDDPGVLQVLVDQADGLREVDRSGRGDEVVVLRGAAVLPLAGVIDVGEVGRRARAGEPAGAPVPRSDTGVAGSSSMDGTSLPQIVGVVIGVFGVGRGVIRLVAELRRARTEEEPVRRPRVVLASVQIALGVAVLVAVGLLIAASG
jgi:hypothetical protein